MYSYISSDNDSIYNINSTLQCSTNDDFQRISHHEYHVSDSWSATYQFTTNPNATSPIPLQKSHAISIIIWSTGRSLVEVEGIVSTHTMPNNTNGLGYGPKKFFAFHTVRLPVSLWKKNQEYPWGFWIRGKGAWTATQCISRRSSPKATSVVSTTNYDGWISTITMYI